MRPGSALLGTALCLAAQLAAAPGAAQALGRRLYHDAGQAPEPLVPPPRPDAGPTEGSTGVPKPTGRGPELSKATLEAIGPAELRGTSRIDATMFTARLVVPIPLPGGKTLVGAALTYDRLGFEARGGAQVPFHALHGGKVAVGALHELTDHASLLVTAQGGLFTDMRDLSGDDVQVGGGVLLDVELAPSLIAGVGATFSTGFELPLPWPTLHVKLTPRPWIQAELNLPTRASVVVRPIPRVEIGAVGSVWGALFDLDEPALGDARVQVTTVYVGPTARVRVLGGLRLGLDGGAALLRDVEVVDAEHALVRDLAPAEAWFLRGGVYYNY